MRVGVVWWYVGSIWWRRKRKGDDMVGGSQNANTSGSNDSLKTIVADIALELQAYQRLLKVNLLVDLQPLKIWQHQADLGNFNFLSKIGLRICGGILGSGQSERLHQIMKNGYGIKRHSLSFDTNKLLTRVKVGLGNEQDVKDHGEYDIPPILSFYEQMVKSNEKIPSFYDESVFQSNIEEWEKELSNERCNSLHFIKQNKAGKARLCRKYKGKIFFMDEVRYVCSDIVWINRKGWGIQYHKTPRQPNSGFPAWVAYTKAPMLECTVKRVACAAR